MSDDAPTLRAIPLRSRQRHRPRTKKGASRWPEQPDENSLPKVMVAAAPAPLPAEEAPAFPAPVEKFPRAETPDGSGAVSNVSFDDHVDAFFRAGDSLAPSERAVTESEAVNTVVAIGDADAEPHDTPHANRRIRERKRRLARVVMAAVAVAAALCVAAFVRSSSARPSIASGAGASHVEATEPTPAEPSADPGATAAGAEPVPPVTAVAALATPEDSPAPAATAVRERARSLLAARSLEDAITTARRATELDPTDAESWLIRGAAELEAHHGAAAIESFRSCTRLATVGPVGECRSFLR